MTVVTVLLAVTQVAALMAVIVVAHLPALAALTAAPSRSTAARDRTHPLRSGR